MNEILQKRIEEKSKELAQKYFPNEMNIWARQNLEAQYVESACKEIAAFILQNQWISVEEALPEEKFDDGYEFVFVIVKIDEETSYYDTDYIRNGKWELHDADKVTHWAEIPKFERR